MQKRIIPLLLVLVILVSCLAVPASAAEWVAPDTSSPSPIVLGTPERTYNDDGTVTVTYDVLNDFHFAMGSNTTYDENGEESGLERTTLQSGYSVSATQEVSTSSVTYNTVSLYSGTFNYSSSTTNSVTGVKSYYSGSVTDWSGMFGIGYDTVEDFFSNVVGVWWKGVFYYTEIFYLYHSAGSDVSYWALGNPGLAGNYASNKDVNGNEYESNGLPFMFIGSPTASNMRIYSLSSITASFDMVSSCEEVTTLTSDYESITALSYPTGYNQYYMPMIDVTKIKSSSGYALTFDTSWSFSSDTSSWKLNLYAYFYDSSGNYIQGSHNVFSDLDITTSGSLVVTVPDGAKYVYLSSILYSNDSAPPSYLNFDFESLTVSTTMTAAENSAMMDSAANSEISDKLDTVHKDLEGVQDGLYDVLDGVNDVKNSVDGVKDSVDQVSGKLDDVNSNLEDMESTMESLPGQIGDELQGIIDSENEKAEQQGNDYADDVIEIVPDYSADFIEALGTLVSVLNYDGTECVLTTPAVVMPAIEGMFPKTELMPSQEIDFEYYFNLMPTELINLVRALFDVALVGYCLKELIDFLSQCFSGIPRDNG